MLSELQGEEQMIFGLGFWLPVCVGYTYSQS